MAAKKDERTDYRLGVRETKFVSYYIETGDMIKAVKMAGYKSNTPRDYAKILLDKPKIQKELKRQLALLQNEAIASADEILRFYTEAMRGEVKDQFGLDPTLADRMKAADALAKRQIDMQKIANAAEDNQVTFTLCFDRKVKAVDLQDVKPTIEDIEDTGEDDG